MMTIKNDAKEIAKQAEISSQDRFSPISYPVGEGILGILVYYFNGGLHGWLGGVSAALILLAIGDFSTRTGYRKGFVDGYAAGVEDASPDSSEYQEWLSEA